MNITIYNDNLQKIRSKLLSLDPDLKFATLQQDSKFCKVAISNYCPVVNNKFVVAIVKNSNVFYCFESIPDCKIANTQDYSFVIMDNEKYLQYDLNQTKSFLGLQSTAILELGILLLELQNNNSKLQLTEWFGELKMRYTKNLKVINIDQKVSYRGLYCVYILTDDDNHVFKWSTADYNLQLHNIYNITFTVKSYLSEPFKLTIIGTCSIKNMY